MSSLTRVRASLAGRGDETFAENKGKDDAIPFFIPLKTRPCKALQGHFRVLHLVYRVCNLCHVPRRDTLPLHYSLAGGVTIPRSSATPSRAPL